MVFRPNCIYKRPNRIWESYFIKYDLSELVYPKKILILVNRTIIKEQFENELLNKNNKEIKEEDLDNITITTYQNIANKIQHKQLIKFYGYDYIICDESHAYTEESVFIFNLDLAFDWVMEQNCIKIFMTATAYYIKSYLEDELKLTLKNYYIKNTYDFIEKLYFYQDDKVVQKLLMDLPPNEKAIYFTSAKKAHELSELLDSCAVFYCSKNNSTYYQYIDEDIENYIVKNEKFEQKVLCTTKVMDCGVNIKDEQVKHLIIDIADLTSIIQCIGRKRIQGNEKFILYIKDKKGNAISRKITHIDDKLYNPNILKEKGAIGLVEENAHQNTYGDLIYDIIDSQTNQINKQVNKLMYFTYSKDKEIYTEMLKDKKDGFKLKLFERMCIDINYTYLEEERDGYTLENILDKLVGVKMFKEEQKKFKEILLKELLNAPKANHGSVGLKTINALFDENKINYIVNSKREKTGENRDKTYWVISKL